MNRQSSEEYFLWQAPGKSFVIRLHYNVIDRLTVEVMRGFGAARRRGTEVGGVLLGRIQPGDKVTVYIEDFQSIPCEYSQGPSYLLSEADLQAFSEAVDGCQPGSGRSSYAVGFFRSHTREGLSLDEADLNLFRQHFEESAHVALLIKPFAAKPSLAGFFVPQNGVLNGASSPAEFVFRRRDGAGGQTPSTGRLPMPRAPRMEITQPVASLEPEAPEALKTSPAASVRPSPDAPPLFGNYQPLPPPPTWRVRLALLCFSVALIVFGVVLGFQLATGKLAPATVSSATDPYAVGLKAVRQGEGVLVTWDRTGQPARTATRGTLIISEGLNSRAVDLDLSQVQKGSVLYRNIAPEINFKLDLSLKDDRSVIETVTFRPD